MYMTARALDWFSTWFTDNWIWGVLIVGVVVGTMAITLRLDHM